MDDLLSKKGLSLDRLRALLAVADAGGIAQAAPGDPVRQSQLSRQLSELEAALGLVLKQRKGRRLALTPAGIQVAVIARDAFQSLQDLSRHAQAQVPTFHMGAGESVLLWWLIPALAAVRWPSPRPDLSLSALGSADILTSLERGELDLGVVRRAAPAGALKLRRIGSLDDVWFAPAKLVAGMSPAQMLAEVPLAVTTGEPGVLEHVRAAARRLGVELRVSLRCDTFPQAARAVASGQFAALLPSLACHELRATPLVVFADPPLGRRGLQVSLAWHPRLDRRPGGTALASALARALESLALKLSAGVPPRAARSQQEPG